MIRVADYIMQELFRHGVTHIFMVSGRGALFLTDAIAAHGEMKAVCLHHEQAAAFAAVAHADSSGNLGACLVSTGCAGTNTLTGVLNAWQDGIPCVFLIGQNKLQETSRFTGVRLRTYGQQEADLIPMVSEFTKYSVMIDDPNAIAYELDKALYLARDGRKGPVWIEIPLDVQNMRINPDTLARFIPANPSRLGPTQEEIQYVLRAIGESSRPVILVGSGVRSSGGTEEFRHFAQKTGIPVVYSASSPDVYGTVFESSIGSLGAMGCSRAGAFAAQNSDLLLVIGCRLNSMVTGPDFSKFARESRVIVVDIDPIEHTKNGVDIDRVIISDAREFLISLADEEIRVDPWWHDKCAHWKTIFPKCEEKYKHAERVDLYHLAELFSEILPRDALLITDSGFIELILPSNISFQPGQRCIHPASQGSMGYALPAAIGAYFASRCSVVSVVGDGSIMMNLQELATIAFNKIPVKIFVISNNAYGIIRKRQRELFGSRTIGTDEENGVGCPSFEKIAQGFDIPFERICSTSEIRDKVHAILSKNGPVLCEILGLSDQEYICVSHARNSYGRYVSRPIEDQAPFLEREVFLREMIIPPIDQ